MKEGCCYCCLLNIDRLAEICCGEGRFDAVTVVP